MTDSKPSFERDRDVARERYPMEMERLETLRAGFDFDFKSNLRHLCQDGHLIRWRDGTHILAYEPGLSPVGLLLRIDARTEHVTDLGVVGKIDCPLLVEVVYDRETAAQDNSRTHARVGADCQHERPQRAEVPRFHYEPYAYSFGVGDYYGDAPQLPAGAIVVPRCTARTWWERETASYR